MHNKDACITSVKLGTSLRLF
jgi:hypothetical protein